VTTRPEEMLRIALATSNLHKAREIAELLSGLPVEILTPEDLGLEFSVTEDGATYEANALKKARVLWEQAGMAAMADDSGLEVDALDGAPGILSARFAGPDAGDRMNNQKLLNLLEHVGEDRRGARFICVAALVGLDEVGTEFTFRGEWEGTIRREPVGVSGFGYDPVFQPAGESATVAELGDAYKRQHSHRARAFGSLAAYLRDLVLGSDALT
jgi:XTP/dITP diphosphohydrolase